MNKFVVMTATAHVPAGRRKHGGQYRRVAVVELTDEFASTGKRPAMISERAAGVVRIVEDWGACFAGSSRNCQYSRAWAAADAMVTNLNAQHVANAA